MNAYFFPLDWDSPALQLLWETKWGNHNEIEDRKVENGKWRMMIDARDLFTVSRCVMSMEYEMLWKIGFLYFKEKRNIFFLILGWDRVKNN